MMNPGKASDQKHAVANLSNLYRIFTIPESPDSTLGKIDQEISQNLTGFLRNRIVATEQDLAIIEQDFSSPRIPEQPTFVSDYTDFLLDTLVAQSVHTAAPGFVGHMTSALPSFMLPLSRIMTALNQNLVKIETSKAFTPMERQVLGMLHAMIYGNDDAYYQHWMHDRDCALGAFCSGGTLANITALWVARNNLFPATEGFRGIAREGFYRALKHYQCEGVAVLISQRGHYSFGKAADLLGIGRDAIVAIPTDRDNRIDIGQLLATCARLREQRIKILSLVGIAGTTETGNVDPLDRLADIAEQQGCHFHVDAAWGGPTLFSETHKPLLKGIERADSVTIDAHKQLYVPMGAGMVLFKNPASLASIEHHAEYILRKGSKDLGSHTLEGSRPGTAMLVHSALNIIGRKGYELLIDKGIDIARAFAEMIAADPNFELITRPELNLLTYRYVPADVQAALSYASTEQRATINRQLNTLTKQIQKSQRAAGQSFVSRTRLSRPKYDNDIITVFRVVLANPLTTLEILREMLTEQKRIAMEDEQAAVVKTIEELISN
ncbi:pyridoxal-dependent aspartate 1-decarboxylase PanP [Sedimenticola selenatireducens]|uniref:pyridoxal-dependent aspartate 1-decarboxylase PanP n=2 Tax=Sedimenticola selenatireducens TaxID=191960 RepID=UPI0004AD0DFD|nr:putative pyridoxal-dependent aspartate 1-decarboxylase [Sedimenticola selenatireducens]